jgi:hypothetical protein
MNPKAQNWKVGRTAYSSRLPNRPLGAVGQFRYQGGHVGFVVNKVAEGKVLLPVLMSSPVRITPPIPRGVDWYKHTSDVSVDSAATIITAEK